MINSFYVNYIKMLLRSDSDTRVKAYNHWYNAATEAGINKYPDTFRFADRMCRIISKVCDIIEITEENNNEH